MFAVQKVHHSGPFYHRIFCSCLRLNFPKAELTGFRVEVTRYKIKLLRFREFTNFSYCLQNDPHLSFLQIEVRKFKVKTVRKLF